MPVVARLADHAPGLVASAFPMLRLDLQLTVAPSPLATNPRDTITPVIVRLRQSKLFRDYRQAFETTTGLPLVLREAGSFRTPLQGSARVNPFCALMTRVNPTCAACLQLQQRLEAEATPGPKTLQCYAGLSETIVPVRVGHKVLGYLQTGQVLLHAPSRKHFPLISRLLHDRRSAPSPREWQAAYLKTRVITPKQYEAIIRLLVIFAEHLATLSNQEMLSRTMVEPLAITRVRAHILAHHAEAMNLRDAARVANMSAFHFCRVFKQATGLTFTAFLGRTRIESVKQKLLDGHLRISEAAFAAGFQSLSQFNRLFREIAGEAPRHYREHLHGAHHTAARRTVLAPAA